MTSVDRLSGVRDGLAFKAPVKAATTANITLSGEQTIDGVAIVEGDRVLVKSQSTTANNGIYVASTGTWTRSVDFDGTDDVVTGTTVRVTSGTLYSGYRFYVTTANPITIGTTGLAFTYENFVESDVATIAITPAQYGCIGDGVTDDTTNMQLAMTAAANKTLDLGGKTYKITATLYPADNCTIQNGTLDGSTLGVSGVLLKINNSTLSASPSSGYNLTANATFGDRTLTLGSTSGLSAGSYIRILTTTADTWATGAYSGESTRVETVDSATQVTLEWPVHDTYTTATTSYVRALANTISDVKLHNLNLIGRGDGYAQTGFSANYATHIVVDGCHFEKFAYCHCEFTGVIGGVVTNSFFRDATAYGLSYGVGIFYGCRAIQVIGNYFSKLRHGVTIGGSQGVNRYISASENTIEYCVDAGLDSHPAGEFYTFANNHIVCADTNIYAGIWTNNTDGITSQGSHATITGNTIYRPLGIGIYHQNTLSGSTSPPTTNISNNTVYYSGNIGIYVINQGQASRGLAVNGNRVIGHRSTGGNPAIYIYANTTGAMTNFAVTGNAVIDNLSGQCLYIRGVSTTDGAVNCYDGIVTGNTFRSAYTSNSYDAVHIYLCRRINVSNNTIQCVGASNGAVRLQDSIDCVISNNTIKHADTASCYSIYLKGSNAYTTVSNNKISCVTPSAVTGIYQEDTTTYTTFANNDLRQVTTRYRLGSGVGHCGGPFVGSATFDPANAADAVGETSTSITVTGAALGDFVQASFSLDLQGILMTAYVSAADTVKVRFQNETGGPIDLGSGTLRARVTKLGE